MSKDYYSILGVEKTASKDDLKRAYRKLAHKYHPDKSGGDETKFKEVNEAYQVLGDEQKRAQYDQFGQTFDGASSGGNPFGGFNVNFEDLGGFGDIFETMFGGGFGRARRQTVRRGNDIGVDVTISFRDSAKGLKKSMEPRMYVQCDVCRGNGAEPGTPIETCTTCNGSGSTTQTRQTPLGVFSTSAVCTACQGEGKIAKQACSNCRGDGRTLETRKLEVDIPAGIADGQQIRVQGKGEAPARGGITGDLYVTVHVHQDKDLTREGDTVRSTVAIPFSKAAMGGTVSVTTLEGDHELSIEHGTQPGTEIRIRGKGFPSIRTGVKSDHVVRVQVEVPKKLSKKQKQLLEEFDGAAKKGFFG